MQIGFGLSPLRSGLVTFASAAGAMGMKTLAARIIKTFGFRNIMTINAVVSSVFLAACALFTIATPLLLIMILLVVGGFFRSLQFTAINTLAYAEVEPGLMSRATTLVSVNQQLAVSAGVAVGAASVESTMWLHHVTELSAGLFAPAFIVVSVISALSAYFWWEMPGRCRPPGVGPRRDRRRLAGARRRAGRNRRHRNGQCAGSAAGLKSARRHAAPSGFELRRDGADMGLARGPERPAGRRRSPLEPRVNTRSENPASDCHLLCKFALGLRRRWLTASKGGVVPPIANGEPSAARWLRARWQ